MSNTIKNNRKFKNSSFLPKILENLLNWIIFIEKTYIEMAQRKHFFLNLVIINK